MKKTITYSLVAITLLSSSCATIFSKSTYPLAVNTTPTGATISITDKKNKEVFKGQSPATVKLKSASGFFSKAEYQVKLTMPGYSEKIIPVTSKVTGWYWGNILIGGLIGMLIIDPATGAMYKLGTKEINESLVTQTASNPGELRILGLNDVPESLKGKLVRIN